MIHWFIFNVMVLITSLALIFNFRIGFTIWVGIILAIIVTLIIIKDYITVFKS